MGVQPLAVSIGFCTCARHLAIKCQDDLTNTGITEAGQDGGKVNGRVYSEMDRASHALTAPSRDQPQWC